MSAVAPLEEHGIPSKTRPARHTAPKRRFGALLSREIASTPVIVAEAQRNTGSAVPPVYRPGNDQRLHARTAHVVPSFA